MDNLLVLVLAILIGSSVFFVGISPRLDLFVSIAVLICLAVIYFYFGPR
jgi:membrane protein YdbS with pleckstrin-like domain